MVSSSRDKYLVSLLKIPSGSPDEAPMSPWLSTTANVSLAFSVRRGREVDPVAGM
jgi:hypothetical protein